MIVTRKIFPRTKRQKLEKQKASTKQRNEKSNTDSKAKKVITVVIVGL